MLSLMVRAGSFHKSNIASGGSKPKPASMTARAHDISIAMASTVAINTHMAASVIFIC